MTFLNNSEISLSIPLDDFVFALKKEIGSVRWVVKQSTFESMLDDAVKKVVLGVQEESNKIV
jgi:hypothetical protein